VTSTGSHEIAGPITRLLNCTAHCNFSCRQAAMINHYVSHGVGCGLVEGLRQLSCQVHHPAQGIAGQSAEGENACESQPCPGSPGTASPGHGTPRTCPPQSRAPSPLGLAGYRTLLLGRAGRVPAVTSALLSMCTAYGCLPVCFRCSACSKQQTAEYMRANVALAHCFHTLLCVMIA
jgi:hypothetical protein